MTILNDLLRSIFDWIQYPIRGFSPLLGIFLWSIPVGIFALWVFGKTSNQDRILAVKRKIHGGLFEIRLFNDDLRAILRAQREILGQVLRYQALALKPMIFILPPFILVMVQLHMFYGFRGLQPGDTTLLTVDLYPGAVENGVRPEINLEVPTGLRTETPAVWIPSLNQIIWRIGIDDWGSYDLRIRVAGEDYQKGLQATTKIERLAPERPSSSFVDQLEWPSEPPIKPAGSVKAISIAYPDGSVGLFGWDFAWRYAWMVVFFLFTMVVALALRKPMGVEL